MKFSEHIHSKILTEKNFDSVISEWKKNHEKIVFTNGCFDIIHRGHVDYLSKARDCGTKLFIGVNTDSSVQKLKGKNRPIQDENSRLIILASLEFVNAVFLFDEETPYELIKKIEPDILVKGSDYKPENIVGYDIVTTHGGQVITLDYIAGFSTSLIEKKIKDN